MVTAVSPFDAEAERTALREALALARQSVGLSDPNPRVGCVVVGRDGRTLGRGFTQAAGDAHAEVMALRDAAARGESVIGATVVVTLEPCAHHGRTPPCAEALVAARVGRVVAAMRDPNPLVAGGGLARLAGAGIETVVLAADDSEAIAARELNVGFVSRMERGRPFVRLKAAVSLDGRSALADGQSQWITGEAARADGHAWRRRAGALLTGVGTVEEDDPRLDVRLVPTARQPLRVVVDSQLRLSPSARIVQPPGTVLVYAATGGPPANGTPADGPAIGRVSSAAGVAGVASVAGAAGVASAAGAAGVAAVAGAGAATERRAALEAAGVEVAVLAGADGKVDLAAMLADLARRGVNELHVETGEKLAGSFLREGRVDELLVYVAPRLLGPGRALAALGPLESLAQTLDFVFVEHATVGGDLRLRLRPRPAGRPGP